MVRAVVTGAERIAIARADGVMTITLACASTANAMSPQMVTDLRRAVAAAADEGLIAVVFRSSASAFSSGFDLRDLERHDDASLGTRFVEIQRLLDDVTSAPLISYALVDGPAVGAGADLVAACDVRVGTERARFRLPGSQFGLALGVHRLLDVTSAAHALELFSGRWIAQDVAHRWGLLTHRACRSADAESLIASMLADNRKLEPTARRLVVGVMRERHRSGVATVVESLTPGVHARVTEVVGRRSAR